MLHNYIRRNVDEVLPVILNDVLGGDEVGSRAGRTKELMHVGITLTRPWEREILLPGRKANIAAQIAETMWVLAGRNDVEFLSHYLPRAADFSDDGKTWRAGYGPRLRTWDAEPDNTMIPVGSHYAVDQLAKVVELLRRDPASRQAVINLWDPTTDWVEGTKDRPCNNWLSFSSRGGALDLMVGIRSNDVMWGWSGINAFEWSAVQEIVAGLLGLHVGNLHFATTSLHLYDRHWAKAEKLASLPNRRHDPYTDSPRFSVSQRSAELDKDLRTVEHLDDLIKGWFQLEYDIRTGSPLAHSYVEEFPEPMMRSWLRVLQWWWGDREGLRPLEGTRLFAACQVAVQPPPRGMTIIAGGLRISPEGITKEEPGNPFLRELVKLHDAKHAAYGDSWKKRGEAFSIIPNIARKVDRLGNGETDDETQADTAADLLVYLAKYAVWLDSAEDANDTTAANERLLKLSAISSSISKPTDPSGYIAALEGDLRARFEVLVDRVQRRTDRGRPELVSAMIVDAYRLAHLRWRATQDDDSREQYRGADSD